MSLCILIPMKDPRQSKQRLAAVLAPMERLCIALNLFRNTLIFLKRHFPSIELLVVTPSVAIAAIAKEHRALVVLEPAAEGLNRAVMRGSEVIVERGFSSQLLIPADIVNLDLAEFEQLIHLPRALNSVIVCPSRDGGTNALLSTPPAIIDFQFGPASSERHLRSAREQQLKSLCLELPNIALDLDTADDLVELSELLIRELKTPVAYAASHARGIC